VDYVGGLGTEFEYVPVPMSGPRPFIGSPPIMPSPR